MNLEDIAKKNDLVSASEGRKKEVNIPRTKREKKRKRQGKVRREEYK